MNKSQKSRLQKAIADSGYCSRRRAEELIREGVVTVNDKVAELGQSVTSGDKITIHDKPLTGSAAKIYIALNKPKGYTCTNRRFKGEKNIFDLVDIDERLFVVGRLDKNSRGLVVLTNDGSFAQKMSHPRYHHEKIYEVTVNSPGPTLSRQAPPVAKASKEVWAKDVVNCLTKGIMNDGDFLVAKKATYLGNNKFRAILTEGKKRQLRRMFAALGLEVTDLIRTQIGKIKLGNLKEGEWKEIDKAA
ncbi:pseudouridine synthase [Candidatus Uhrbacteria bacterium]|nr:pseudouridine synthase [Candidatus Uhrbacteria bacterium]